MSRKLLPRMALIILSILVVLVTGCTKAEEEIVVEKEPEPVIEVETPKDPDEVMKEFYAMINGDETTKNITMFVINSIENLDESKADTMILDYEGYLIQDLNPLLKQYENANNNPDLSKLFETGIKESMASIEDVELKDLLNKTLDSGYLILKGGGYIYPEIDYSEILKHREYISPEVVDYLEIMEEETKNRYTYGGEIEISLEELLNRSLKAENYLARNNDSASSNKIYELYIQYINGAILGTGNPYVLANEGTSIIKDEILNEYKTFATINKDSRTSEILQEYINILEDNNNEMDSAEVLEFYDNRYSNIKYKFGDLGL